MKLVMLTGHRPNKLGGYSTNNPVQKRIRKRLTKILSGLGHKEAKLGVISGMAIGADQIWAEVAVELGIPFSAYMPFKGQESKWPELSQQKYRKLLDKAYHAKFVNDGEYAVWKMQKRNEAMVDDADLCIAVWDGTSGGTANCVEYIIKSGKPCYCLNPKTGEEFWIQKQNKDFLTKKEF